MLHPANNVSDWRLISFLAAHAALIPRLEQALRDMKAGGIYAAIFKELEAK
jgi:hypothetical protein